MTFVGEGLGHSDQNQNHNGTTDASKAAADKRRATPATATATPTAIATAIATTSLKTSGGGVIAAGLGGGARQGSTTSRSAMHWRKVRSAVAALTAFKRRQVSDERQ